MCALWIKCECQQRGGVYVCTDSWGKRAPGVFHQLTLSSLDLLDPATDSMLCQCVSELCHRAVSVRKGCVQTSGRYVQTTLGSAQATELSVMFKRAVSVRCVNVYVTAIETLIGERMCADSGRTYADIFQKINRQRKGERLRGTIEGSIAIERLRARGRGARRWDAERVLRERERERSGEAATVSVWSIRRQHQWDAHEGTSWLHLACYPAHSPRQKKRPTAIPCRLMSSLLWLISYAYDLSYSICLMSYTLLYTFISCLVVCCRLMILGWLDLHAQRRISTKPRNLKPRRWVKKWTRVEFKVTLCCLMTPIRMLVYSESL